MSTLTTITLNRDPAIPPILGEHLLDGLAAVPYLDEHNQLTPLVITVHAATGNTFGNPLCITCRRENLTHLTHIDWTRPLDQLDADPATHAAERADETIADKCTLLHHWCHTGDCKPARRGGVR
ncbi:hypothetical protein [Verrucosispora sp. WMMD1129]|uniref:hypothetical protein n=1 Tax=Verrucosispora sp. WMMD1129 TaxID=3016093 RepID=UPI00249BB3F2|nr:hypothetical protein [Verrucosispora sp. WMMD1129]WFE45330.1 hypothetical protein O7624_13695 [Verrucosispora sp. WMMD1129]